MNIRRKQSSDSDVLFDIWNRSVRATHTFLREADVEDFAPLVHNFVSSDASDIWVLCSDAQDILGFMGMTDKKIDALFVAPEYHRQGCGRRLVQHAQRLYEVLTLDVNEQNPAAQRFYESCGFVVEGRSQLDSTGRPFPIVHMRMGKGEKFQ